MRINGVDYGPACDAAGVRNFDGKGWVHHHAFPGMFRRPKGVQTSRPWYTFVTKTVTAEALSGNMPLEEDGITPKEWLPRCIVPGPNGLVRPMLTESACNSVGLSNRGIHFYAENGVWDNIVGPWRLSVMAVKDGRGAQLLETETIRDAIEESRHRLPLPMAVEDNESCPNTGHDLDHQQLLETVEAKSRIVARLDLPLVVKVVCTIPPSLAVELMELPGVAGLVSTNTFKWGTYPDLIDYKELFGTDTSPLEHLVPGNPDSRRGGISGRVLLDFNAEWIAEVRKLGGAKPICASGGVMSTRSVRVYKEAGADAVSIGSVAILRPWRVNSIIHEAHRVFV